MDSVSTSVSTHCPYCALQCGMDLTCEGDRIGVAGNRRFPVNEGGLCLKGWSAAATLQHPDRLLSPLARNADGMLEPVVVGDRDRQNRIRDSRDAGEVRPRCGRRVRRRLADQREGLSAGEVRARCPGHIEHRLQRPLLHVFGCSRRVEGVRHRSRPAVSARRHSRCRSDPARRRQHGRNDAADHAVLRGPAAQRRRVDRRRPPSLADRAVGDRFIWRCARVRTRRWRTGWFTC